MSGSIPPGAVWLDIQGSQLNPGRGIARYTNEHARALLRLAPEAIGALRVNPGYPDPEPVADVAPERVLRWGARNGSLPPQSPPALYHVMSPFDGLALDDVWPPWSRSAGRTVVTLFDLIPHLLPEDYLADPRIRAGYSARLQILRCADHVLALSQVSADDAVDHLGLDSSRVTVIEAGVTTRLAELAPDAGAAWRILEALPSVRPGFVLYVGGADPRKNLAGLIEAYGLMPERLRSEHPLVIACALDPGWEELMREREQAAGLNGGELVLTGFVTDEQLAALYRACELFVFPSLYEGFGLPIVEAASCGAPVISGRLSTSAEVLEGDLTGSFDPRVPQEIADAIERALIDDELATVLSARTGALGSRFTWERVAERSLEAYERTLARAPRMARPSRSRPRVAVFTPWPPERSGIADYNRRAMAELERLADVEIVTVGAPAEHEPGPGPRPVLDERGYEITDRLGPFDHVLCCVGNSVMHAHAYRALMRRPGVVIAHDVRLSGFYAPMAEVEDREDPDGWFRRKLEGMYGDAAPPIPRNELPWSATPEARGAYMTREIQAHATRVLVHSADAAWILASEAPSPAPPIDVVPFGVPEAMNRQPSGRFSGEPLVVFLGSISPAKPVEAVLDAFARFAVDVPGARLVIAGHALEDVLDRARARAAELGVAGSTEVLGRVGDAAYWDLIASADMALGVRTVSNGEASAAVADCFAARLPLIVTDFGWYSELPADVADRVAPAASPAELASAIARLAGDSERRGRMAAAQAAHAARSGFAAVAEAYAAALGI